MISPAPSTYKDNIIVTVAVLAPQVPGGKPRLVCPPFIVPPGDWVVIWNLVTISQAEVVAATFPKAKGIVPLLGQGQNFTLSTQISDTQWLAKISSGPRDDKGKAFPFSYEVRFYYPATKQKRKHVFSSTDRELIRHDPTIVVSQDPVEPN